MIDFGNLAYRNIQEQVAKNASDIMDLEEGKQDKLTAGEGISIDSGNVISSSVAGSTLYLHSIAISNGSRTYTLNMITTSETALTGHEEINNSLARNCLMARVHSSALGPGEWTGDMDVKVIYWQYNVGVTLCGISWSVYSSAISISQNIPITGTITYTDTITEI